MYSFQTQRMAQFHREQLQREAAEMRVSDSTNLHLQEKQGSNHMRKALRRGCLIAFTLGVVTGSLLNTQFGLLPIILLGSIMALVMSPSLLIQSAATLKAHLSTFQQDRTGHWWRGLRLLK